jgi:hypothetical protein
METVLEAPVIMVQLALAGFVAWGAWQCFRRGLQQSFERAVSLVLLALLCTTIAGLG